MTKENPECFKRGPKLRKHKMSNIVGNGARVVVTGAVKLIFLLAHSVEGMSQRKFNFYSPGYHPLSVMSKVLNWSTVDKQACSSHYQIVIWFCFWFYLSNSTKLSTNCETAMFWPRSRPAMASHSKAAPVEASQQFSLPLFLNISGLCLKVSVSAPSGLIYKNIINSIELPWNVAQRRNIWS